MEQLGKALGKMKILVTGGAGFIGTNLVKRLVEIGHEVQSIDNYSTGLKTNESKGCLYFDMDVQKISRIDKNFDMVFHLAAIARIGPSFQRPEDYIKTNFDGTYEVVKFCVSNNIPLFYAGTSSKHSGRFKNPYTFSKDLGEDIVKLYQIHFGLRASIGRFYNVYGPYQLVEGGYSTLIGCWINNIQTGRQCEIFGDGEQRRDFTHVDDIIDALILIMEKCPYGLEFELGRGRNHSVNELAKMFNIKPLHREAKKGEAKNTLNTDFTSHEILGWNPIRDVEEYIKNFTNK